MINEEYDTLKKIPLIEFILAGKWGYQEDKQKSCRRWMVLCNKENKLLIRSKPNPNGHWIFTNQKSDEKGTIIDFLKMEGEDIKDFLSVRCPLPPLSTAVQIEVEAACVKELMLSFKKFWHEKNDNYLLDRSIAKTVIQDYIYRENTHIEEPKTNPYGAIFPLWAGVDKNLKGIFSSFAKYNSAKDKYHPNQKRCKGAPKGLSVLKQVGDFDELFICESPIDALSLETLYRAHNIEGKRAYISTCGMLSSAQLQNLKTFLPHLQKKIILAFDADQAGRQMVRRIQKEVVPPIEIKYPKKGKDWNEYLN